jgi:hypothetical protein
VLAARAVNSDWNQLITGFSKAGIVGVENKPSHIIDTGGWATKEVINCKKDYLNFYSSNYKNNNKFETLTPEVVPSFFFYQLMSKVMGLPQIFWPYLQGTNVHTLDLCESELGAQGAEGFARLLQGTSVHTVDLSSNRAAAKRLK